MPVDPIMLKEVEQTAQKFAARHIESSVLDVDHQPSGFPEEVFKKGLEAGFDQLALPEQAGGSDFSMVELCALLMNLAKCCAGHAMVFGVHAALVQVLFEHGPKDALMEVLKSGEPLGVVVPEPLGADDFETTVRLVLNAKSQGRLVWFERKEGIPRVLLIPAQAAGLSDRLDALGLRAMPIAEISPADFDTGADLIAEGEKARIFYRCLITHLSLVTAASAAGLMAGAYQKALDYAADRYQGGKIIIDHSHLRSILGGMAAQVTAARGMVLGAASQPSDHLAALGAKVCATESAVQTSTNAVQVLGGYGYMHEYGMEKAMRDAGVLSLLPISNARAELLITALEKARIS